jgi:hypothetical protein
MYRTRYRGMGAPQGAIQAVGTISALGAPIATTAIAGALSTGAAAGSAAGATILGMSASLAVPIIGAALAGITIGIEKLIQNSGCGPTCVQTSAWANQAEPYLKQNIAAYFALPAPRSQSAQAAALANFDAIWNQLLQLCSQPDVGNAGKRCISDRQSGACTWKQTSDSPLLQFPGEPAPGACWNWFNGYRDPISMDAAVPDSQSAGPVDSIGSTGLSIGLLAALALLAIGVTQL